MTNFHINYDRKVLIIHDGKDYFEVEMPDPRMLYGLALGQVDCELGIDGLQLSASFFEEVLEKVRTEGPQEWRENLVKVGAKMLRELKHSN